MALFVLEADSCKVVDKITNVNYFINVAGSHGCWVSLKGATNHERLKNTGVKTLILNHSPIKIRHTK
uniref:Uncharacterized protein n=1 Tax=Ciona intestinalis TaxID=7719 RepID=H2XW00_CIOIN